MQFFLRITYDSCKINLPQLKKINNKYRSANQRSTEPLITLIITNKLVITVLSAFKKNNKYLNTFLQMCYNDHKIPEHVKPLNKIPEFLNSNQILRHTQRSRQYKSENQYRLLLVTAGHNRSIRVTCNFLYCLNFYLNVILLYLRAFLTLIFN